MTKKGTRLKDYLSFTQRMSLRVMGYFLVFGSMGAIYKISRVARNSSAVYTSVLLPSRRISEYLETKEYTKIEKGFAFSFCSQPLYTSSHYARKILLESSYSRYEAEQRMLSMLLLIMADDKYVLRHANTSDPNHMTREEFIEKF